MRILRFLSLILFSCLVACSPLSDDQRYIVSFLAERGAEVNGGSFTCQYRGDGIKLYNSPDGQFVLLADTVYSRTLQGQRVLAFSTTNGWGTGISMRKFFSYYEQTLRLAYHQHIQIPASGFQDRIAPLLSFSWGQKAPYNAECPDDVLAGCVPVAISEIIHFHQPTENPARLIAHVGQRVGVHYSSKKGSVTNSFEIKPFLVRIGYSAQSRYLSGLSRAELLQICRSDLQQGWPLLLSNGDHAFVGDGLWGDYLHCRMGWDGDYDGYFRLLPADVLSWEPNIVSSVVCHIRLMNTPYTERTIHLTKAGTLGEVLGADSLTLNSLVVTGPMNGKDVRLIRRMAGAASNRLEPIGSLRRVNIRGAHLQRDDIYRTVDAVATGYKYRKKGEEFDFKQMTLQRWARFCKLGYDHRPGYITERDDDGRYWVHFTLTDTKDRNLWLGCDNLLI